MGTSSVQMSLFRVLFVLVTLTLSLPAESVRVSRTDPVNIDAASIQAGGSRNISERTGPIPLGFAIVACFGVVGCGLAIVVAYALESQLHDLDWLE